MTGALQGAESDPSKNPGSEKKRGPKRSGQRRKRVEANKAKAGEKTEKKEAEKEKASWAEVAARGFPTLLLENGGRGMEHEDYLEFFQQLGDWVIEEETTCQQSYILKSGLREGGISVIFKHPEGIQWLKNHVDKLAALKEGDTGYTVYGPGEKPYTLFTVYTSDTKAVIRKDRFVGILWKNNPDLHKHNTIEGEIKVLGGFPLKNPENPGMKVRVAFTNSLVQNLADMKFELQYLGGFLKFKRASKKKTVSTDQAKDNDIEVIDLDDEKDEALEGDYMDPDHMLCSESEDDA